MTMAEVRCGRCGEEIRHGVREGITDWWHREAVDHHAILGRAATTEDLAELERQYTQVVRTYEDGSTYTTAEHDIARDKDVDRRRRRQAELRGEPLQTEVFVPPVETACHPVDVDSFAPRSGIRQVVNLVARSGWELRRLTHARGPYIGAGGEVLSISDSVVLGATGPDRLDGTTPVAVASWRDGKFDFAYTGIIKDGRLSTTKADATTMKGWIKAPMTSPEEDAQ